ncbi:putative prephenate dehydrogenase [Hortaea werneckii]|nr:putative prephenate dehydrogenase [Hortaea werneckii]
MSQAHPLAPVSGREAELEVVGPKTLVFDRRLDALFQQLLVAVDVLDHVVVGDNAQFPPAVYDGEEGEMVVSYLASSQVSNGAVSIGRNPVNMFPPQAVVGCPGLSPRLNLSSSSQLPAPHISYPLALSGDLQASACRVRLHSRHRRTRAICWSRCGGNAACVTACVSAVMRSCFSAESGTNLLSRQPRMRSTSWEVTLEGFNFRGFGGRLTANNGTHFASTEYMIQSDERDTKWPLGRMEMFEVCLPLSQSLHVTACWWDAKEAYIGEFRAKRFILGWCVTGMDSTQGQSVAEETIARIY